MELPHPLADSLACNNQWEQKGPQRGEREGEHVAWEQGCCLGTGGLKDWKEWISFPSCCVLGLNGRESMWVGFPVLRVPVGICVCAAVSAQQNCIPGRSSDRLWRMGRLMGPGWVHGGMALASVNVPFQRRFPVAHYILAEKAPPVQIRVPTDAVCWCWKIAWSKLWIFTCLCYNFLLWKIPC